MFKFSSDKGEEIALIKRNKNVVDRIFIFPNDGNDTVDEVSKKNKNLKIIDNVFNLPKGYEIILSPFLYKNQTLRHVFFGASGSGKTTFAAKFIKNFHDVYPNKQIYIFSRHDEDPSLDEVIGDFSLRVKITEKDVIEAEKNNEPLIKMEDLEGSLCLFDDLNQKSTILTKYMFGLNDDIQINGRHKNISIIHILHNTNYKETRFTLSEAGFYVFFLNTVKPTLRKIMVRYCGLTEKEATYLTDLENVRWVAIRTIGHQYIITEKQIFSYKYLSDLVKNLP